MTTSARKKWQKRNNGALPSEEWELAKSKLGVEVGRAFKAFEDVLHQGLLEKVVKNAEWYGGVTDWRLLQDILRRGVDGLGEVVCFPDEEEEEEEEEEDDDDDDDYEGEPRDEYLVARVEAWMVDVSPGRFF